MYLALTYDHRLLDGREAVTFLVKVCYPRSLQPESRANRVTGQGIHRGPSPYAAWLKTRVLSLLSVFSYPRAALRPFVNYEVPRYKFHIKERSFSGL
jgi:hypothetical protein